MNLEELQPETPVRLRFMLRGDPVLLRDCTATIKRVLSDKVLFRSDMRMQRYAIPRKFITEVEKI